MKPEDFYNEAHYRQEDRMSHVVRNASNASDFVLARCKDSSGIRIATCPSQEVKTAYDRNFGWGMTIESKEEAMAVVKALLTAVRIQKETGAWE